MLCVASSPGDTITQLNPSHFTDVLAKAVIFTLVPRLVWGGGGAGRWVAVSGVVGLL